MVGFLIAAAAAFISSISVASVVAFAARTLLTIGVAKLLSNRSDGGAQTGAQDAGARVQLQPATNNKIPVVYGSAFIAPTITDAKISTDSQTMWYVCALAEKTSGTYSFGDIYYDGKKVTFDGTDHTKVVSLTTTSDPVQVDTKIDGKLFIYQFSNGSSSGVNTSQTAIDILSDPAIPAAQRWTANNVMGSCAFVIVKIIYNRDANTINLGQLNIQLNNTLTKPGAVLYDYFTNTIYGCAIPAENVDSLSLNALDTYADQVITYIPVGGGTATQPRYRVNGPINTGNDCLTNLQQIIDTSDCWLQFSEITGQWKVVINRSFLDYSTLANLYHVTDSQLIGGININPIDLNSTYNSVEVQYPDHNIRDQTNYSVTSLYETDPGIISPNEPNNRLTLQFPQVNNFIQATYLGIRRLYQGREDLIISFYMDYSGIQIDAGDVVRITFAPYGWVDKCFRVQQVQESKDEKSNLGAHITAFEYNNTIYADNTILNFVPEANTGLSNPNIIGVAGTPIITDYYYEDGSISYFTVESTVPITGSVLYMDFNYGTSTDLSTHRLYRTVSTGNGSAFIPGQTVKITVTDLVADTYYWSMNARNNSSGNTSPNSSAHNWTGLGISVYNPVSNTGGVAYSNMAPGGTGFSLTDSFGTTDTVPFPGFINVQTSGQRHAPMVIPGNTAGAIIPTNKYWPWGQGTASTAEGYYTNSTGPYLPDPGASYCVVNEGGSGWFRTAIINTNGSLQSYETGEYFYNLTLTTDVAGARIQICPYAIFGGSNPTPINQYQLSTEYQEDLILTNVAPFISSISLRLSLGGSVSILTAGLAVRNLTPGANVYILTQTAVLKQLK